MSSRTAREPPPSQGHPDSWLEGIRLNHVRLFVSHGADAPYESTTAAMTLRYARDVAMKDVEIRWEDPHAATWQSGLTADQVQDLLLEDMRIDAAPGSDQPVLRLNDADGVLIRQSQIASVDVTGRQEPRRAPGGDGGESHSGARSPTGDREIAFLITTNHTRLAKLPVFPPTQPLVSFDQIYWWMRCCGHKS